MMRDLFRRLGFRHTAANTEPDTQPERSASSCDDRPQSPIELYEASGRVLGDAPPKTQEILRLAEESHRRRYVGAQSEDEIDSDGPEAQGALHAHQITPADAAMMRRMAGASFNPESTVTLPSGRTVTGAEMQRWLDSQM